MDKVAVLIPCYNEALTIEKVVRDFLAVLPENSRVYVYDNNSTDGTANLQRRPERQSVMNISRERET